MTSQTLYVPISSDVAEEARRTRMDRFGHALAPIQAVAPCRVCLQIPTSPEALLLLSYQPLADRNPYAEIGPIFIHEHTCTPYAALDRFPEAFRSRDLIIRAYDANGRIYDAVVAAPGEGERLATAFLHDPLVEEVHVRHTSYTCFDFKIVRNPTLHPTVASEA